MGKPEGKIETYLRKQAEKIGYLCLKFTSPANNGVPDRIVIGDNLTVFIELKAPGEEPRPLQRRVINNMIQRGAYVYVIDNKKDIDKLLSNMQNHKLPKPQKLKIKKIKL